jgi:small subunit ribosomal protein S3
MGRKVNPVAFRIGTTRDWTAKWHADKHFVEYLQEDIKLRKAIAARYKDAGVSNVEIERQANKVTVNIHTSRPGIVIGRGGQRVDETRKHLEEVIGKRVQLNILEVAQPELDAYLVSRAVAEQIERRIAYRRAMKQAIFRSMQAGAEGIKISASGRLGGVEIARRQVMHQGRVPLHTLRADIDYGYSQAYINMGRIGIKVWIYRGDILPERAEEEFEEAPPAAEALVEETAAPVAEKPAEAAPEEKAKPVDKKPAKPRAKKAEKAEAVTEVEAKPAVEATVEVAPVAEKPAKPKAVKKEKPTVAKAEPAKPKVKKATKVEAAPVEAEKPAKPKAKKVTKAKAEAAPVEAEKPAEPKEAPKAKPKAVKKKKPAAAKAEPAKPKAKKATKAEAEVGEKAPAAAKAKPKAKKKVEKKDATAQEG